MVDRDAPYHLLADVYDSGWGDYSEYIYGLIRHIEAESRRVFRRICDAACGTGLLLQRLRNGEVERELAGYDISVEMLSHARGRLPGVPLIRGDLRDPVPFEPAFDLVLSVYDSVNYLMTREDLTRFFREARNVVAGDGLLLIDANSSALYRQRHDERIPRLVDGVPFHQVLSYRPGPPPEVETIFSFDAGQEIHRQRPWEPSDVETLLHRTGWDLLDSLDVVDEDTNRPSGKIVYLGIPA